MKEWGQSNLSAVTNGNHECKLLTRLGKEIIEGMETGSRPCQTKNTKS